MNTKNHTLVDVLMRTQNLRTQNQNLSGLLRRDPGRRFPIVSTEEDFRAAALNLSDEEIRLGVQMSVQAMDGVDWEKMKEVLPDHYEEKVREPWRHWLYDPELFRAMYVYYEPMSFAASGCTNETHHVVTTGEVTIDALTNDLELRRKYRNSSLMNLKVMYELHDEYWFRMISTGQGIITPEKLSVIANPESSVWSDEERLVLRFAKAVLEVNVTDELFNEACALWGPKQLLSNTQWIACYLHFSMMYGVNVSDAERHGFGRDLSGALRHAHIPPFRRPRVAHARSGSAASAQDVDKMFGLPRRDPARRFPDIVTEDDARAVPYLNDQERSLAVRMRKQAFDPDKYQWANFPDHDEVKKRDPMRCLLHDPAIIAPLLTYYEALTARACGISHEQHSVWTSHKAGIDAVTSDPVVQHKWRLGQLMAYKVAYEYRDEWCCRYFATASGFVRREHIAAMGFPESTVWSEDERLALCFTTAVLDGTVTDELVNKACAVWGPKQVVGNANWIGFNASMMTISAVNISDAARQGAVSGTRPNA